MVTEMGYDVVEGFLGLYHVLTLLCKESETCDVIIISSHLQHYGLNANSLNSYACTHTHRDRKSVLLTTVHTTHYI